MSKLKCPKCRSTNIQVMNSSRSRISISKGLVGGFLFGGIGLGASLLGNKGKYECHCQDCGKRFTTR